MHQKLLLPSILLVVVLRLIDQIFMSFSRMLLNLVDQTNQHTWNQFQMIY